MASARVARGRKTQGLLASYWNKWWPTASAVWGSMPGRDITGMPGLAPEVKATSDGPLLKGLRQATKNAKGDLPFVVWRPDGYGPERIEEWVMAFTVKDGTHLLLESGYGTREVQEDWADV